MTSPASLPDPFLCLSEWLPRFAEVYHLSYTLQPLRAWPATGAPVTLEVSQGDRPFVLLYAGVEPLASFVSLGEAALRLVTWHAALASSWEWHLEAFAAPCHEACPC